MRRQRKNPRRFSFAIFVSNSCAFFEATWTGTVHSERPSGFTTKGNYLVWAGPFQSELAGKLLKSPHAKPTPR